MRAIGERTCKIESGAWGHPSNVCRQRYLIEASDQGKALADYLGYERRPHRFTQADVGRTIEILSDGRTQWTAWSFVPEQVSATVL